MTVNARNDATEAATNQETEDTDSLVLYDVVWKTTKNNRKGVKDTIERVKDHPADLWNRSLHSILRDALAAEGLQDGQPFDTTVIVFASGRDGDEVERRFKGLEIDWDWIYDKFVAWSDTYHPGRKLKTVPIVQFQTSEGKARW